MVKRILKELEDHGLRDSQASDLTLDTVSRLTYTGYVVKEVLRLAPPVGAGFRKALRTFELDVSAWLCGARLLDRLNCSGDKDLIELWRLTLFLHDDIMHDDIIIITTVANVFICRKDDIRRPARILTDHA